MSAVDSAARAAGRYLAVDPYGVPLDTPFSMERIRANKAIYLAFTAGGDLDYIGRVDRPDQTAAARRLAEHVRLNTRKRRLWRWLWVVPLTADITKAHLQELERALIIMHCPPGNVQHVRDAHARPA